MQTLEDEERKMAAKMAAGVKTTKKSSRITERSSTFPVHGAKSSANPGYNGDQLGKAGFILQSRRDFIYPIYNDIL